MPSRPLTAAWILALAVVAALVAFAYGPSRRVYASPPRAVGVATAADACREWERSGVRGRVALVFARDLISAESSHRSPDVEAIERAMHHGIVRQVYHVVPDALWPGVALSISHLSIYWQTSTGSVGAFEDGRVNVLPFSRLWTMAERALVVVDPGVWSRDELWRLAQRIETDSIRTDLVAVLGGTRSDLELFDGAMTAVQRPGTRTDAAEPR